MGLEHDRAAPVPAVPSAPPAPSTLPNLPTNIPTRWNTERLGLRLASDAIAAGTAASLIAPVIAIIDRAIIENASGRQKLMASVRSSFGELLLRPQRFFVSKPFALIYMLYSSTYLTANTIDTLSATTTNQTSLTTTTGPLKFLGTSTVNMSLCLYKDSQFARLFGPPNSIPRAVPAASYALFAFRDSLTIFASFNVPPLLAPHMPVSEAFERSVLSRASAAQFVAPAAMQLVSTPLHLLGLDLYNRGEKAVGWGSRWQKVRKDWLKSSAARMCRIVPAFGVGGVVNLRVREGVMRRLGCS